MVRIGSWPSAINDNFDRTVISFRLPKMKSSTAREIDTGCSNAAVESKTFSILFAQQSETLSSASLLIQKRYASRGFPEVHLKRHPNRINIVASAEDEIVGTLVVGYDSEQGLLGDEIYNAEIDALRTRGRKVFELSKLTMDEKQGSRQLLAGMIHVAYLCSRLRGFNDSIIEIVPHHKTYYERALGFKQIGEQKVNSRVNSIVLLMHVDLAYMAERIRARGEAGKSVKDRSLYPYFFSTNDQNGIISRLMREEE